MVCAFSRMIDDKANSLHLIPTENSWSVLKKWVDKQKITHSGLLIQQEWISTPNGWRFVDGFDLEIDTERNCRNFEEEQTLNVNFLLY